MESYWDSDFENRYEIADKCSELGLNYYDPAARVEAQKALAADADRRRDERDARWARDGEPKFATSGLFKRMYGRWLEEDEPKIAMRTVPMNEDPT
jgi:hypothetical protein